MKRKDAIRELGLLILDKLSVEEKADRLETIRLENWEEHDEWILLDKDLIQAFKEGDARYDPRFDPILLISVMYSLRSVSNDFLTVKLNSKVLGTQDTRNYSCPCCGMNTIDELKNYEICKVCWWEDDGQDDSNLYDRGGANYGISLFEARINYQNHGIYDPRRSDLLKLREPESKYTRGRIY